MASNVRLRLPHVIWLAMFDCAYHMSSEPLQQHENNCTTQNYGLGWCKGVWRYLQEATSLHPKQHTQIDDPNRDNQQEEQQQQTQQ